MRLAAVVEVRRGRVLESRHRVQAAVVDPAGERIAVTRHPDLVTTLRSAAKPFQLLPLVESGHADRWGFTDEQLAVMAASHTGSAYHVALVQEILARIALSDRDLACGFHDPLDAESQARLRAHPEMRSPLYNNCSGKHAGMLALARAEGWPVEGYERADHSVQKRMLQVVAELCGVPAEDVLLGIDGCSVTVFGMPLDAMARGYARLASAHAEGDPRARALARIRSAMLRYPLATGGAQRFSTSLMEATEGAVLAKGGAEGLECVGVPGRGWGIAVKCEDGHTRAVAPAVIELLDAIGLLEPAQTARLETWRRPVLRNYAGLEVGELHARVEALETLGGVGRS